MKNPILAAALFLLPFALVHAQGNYEIQVYPSETQDPGTTMVELHSNFTFEGSKGEMDGVLGTEHQLHETVEVTEGINPWFEIGFYYFSSAEAQQGYSWVGDHIRPRVRVPEDWKWPVGVSLSVEVGYQRYRFFPDTWTMELRPIVDKQLGRWYLAFNPVLDRAFHGPDVSQGLTFSPNVKVGYDFTKKINAGFEYYGTTGTLTELYPIPAQTQDLFAVTDLNLSPKWEFNFGVGVGLTGSTDHLIVKMILGRRFGKVAAQN